MYPILLPLCAISFPKEAVTQSLFLMRLRKTITIVFRTIKLLLISGKVKLFCLLCLTAVSALLPIALTWVGRQILDSVLHLKEVWYAGSLYDSYHPVLNWVAVELLLMLAGLAVERWIALLQQQITTRLSQSLMIGLMNKAGELNLSHFENPSFYDKLLKARREVATRPLLIMQRYFSCIRYGSALIGYIAFIGAYNPWIAAILIISMLPSFLMESSRSRSDFLARDRRTASLRKLQYLETMLTGDIHVKELKMLGNGPSLIRYYSELSSQHASDDFHRAKRTLRAGLIVSLAATLFLYYGYSLIVLDACLGAITVGAMTQYLMLSRLAQAASQGLLGTINLIHDDHRYIQNYFDYMDIPNDIVWGEKTCGPRPGDGIRLVGVSFAYPGSSVDVLSNVTMHFPEGSRTAIVGTNGSGKTTIMKLMCGLYAPTAGKVLLDGLSLLEWEPAAFRSRLGVLFQDFNRYHFTLRDNVLVGAGYDRLASDTAVLEALREAGIENMSPHFPDGLDTQLGRWFADGYDISTGTWQKVGVARTFMRREHGILILDEPTSALDPSGEDLVRDRLHNIDSCKTVILISHRLGIVVGCDNIIVIADGKLAEQGSHDVLLARNGVYNQLYQKQVDSLTCCSK